MGFIEFFGLNTLEKPNEIPVKNLLHLKNFSSYDFIHDLDLNIYEKDELLSIINSFIDDEIDSVTLQGLSLYFNGGITFGPRAFQLGTLFKVYLDPKCRAYAVLFTESGGAEYKKVKLNNSFCHFVNIFASLIKEAMTPKELDEKMKSVILNDDSSITNEFVDIIIETMRRYNVDRKEGLIEDPQATQ